MKDFFTIVSEKGILFYRLRAGFLEKGAQGIVFSPFTGVCQLQEKNIVCGRLPDRAMKPAPLYRKRITLIEQGIESGALSGGERLPSERQLSALLKVNRSTVLRALDELTDRGGSFLPPDSAEPPAAARGPGGG